MLLHLRHRQRLKPSFRFCVHSQSTLPVRSPHSTIQNPHQNIASARPDRSNRKRPKNKFVFNDAHDLVLRLYLANRAIIFTSLCIETHTYTRSQHLNYPFALFGAAQTITFRLPCIVHMLRSYVYIFWDYSCSELGDNRCLSSCQMSTEQCQWSNVFVSDWWALKSIRECLYCMFILFFSRSVCLNLIYKKATDWLLNHICTQNHISAECILYSNMFVNPICIQTNRPQNTVQICIHPASNRHVLIPV